MERIKKFIKKQTVFVVALICAIISCFIIPVDKHYIGYFDKNTLMCLFSMMAVICAIQSTNVLQFVSTYMIGKLKNTRMLCTGLVFLTFIASIFIANDMALLTFLPLTVTILKSTKQESKAIYIFLLQNIGANLGGMLTPFGNPQNIYLYNYYNISNKDFFAVMLPVFIASIIVLYIATLLIKKEPLKIYYDCDSKIDKPRLAIYSVLFVIAVLMVLKVIPYTTVTLIVMFTLLIMNRQALKNVDYVLLLTFCAFFVLTGNLSRIEVVTTVLSKVVVGREFWISLLLTQIICNVPTAILVSGFTTNFAPILIAVNIGALGTLISSLASLITFNIYNNNFGGSKLKYILCLTGINLIFLMLITGVAFIFVL